MMLPDAGVRIGRVISPYDRKVFISPMEEGLRVAGTVEFGGLEAAPNEARAQLLLRICAPCFRMRASRVRRAGWAIAPACPTACP